MANPFARCPRCHKASTNLWMNLYTGGYTGRTWGGTCNSDGCGKWAESTACKPRPAEDIS